MTYDGTKLTMTITDTVTNATFTTSWTINIPAIVGGNTAYVGFTGGTGRPNRLNKKSSAGPILRMVRLNRPRRPEHLTGDRHLHLAQTVTITDATAGSTIF